MKKSLLAFSILFSALTATAADAPTIQLPTDLSGWTRYGTEYRGSMEEELYINNDALKMMKASDKEFPFGTKILLIERIGDNQVRRYIIMQKEKDFGKQFPESIRNGNWEYQAYHGDKRPFTEAEDSVSRCMSCHKGASGSDYVFTFDQVKSHLKK